MKDFVKDVLPLKNQLYRLALRLTLNHQEAEDIVQDTLLRIWNNHDRWDEIDSMEAYALRICRNLSLDHIKRHENRNLSLEDIDTEQINSGVDPLAQIQNRENVNRIRSIMDSLPEKQRTCMHLRDFEAKTYKEIADILEITEEQVKVNIFRARKTVKEKYENIVHNTIL